MKGNSILLPYKFLCLGHIIAYVKSIVYIFLKNERRACGALDGHSVSCYPAIKGRWTGHRPQINFALFYAVMAFTHYSEKN